MGGKTLPTMVLKGIWMDSDNVSASMFEPNLNLLFLSFNDLSYVNGLKPDNETYLCGESYWTGVERDVTSCGFNWKSYNKEQ